MIDKFSGSMDLREKNRLGIYLQMSIAKETMMRDDAETKMCIIFIMFV